MADGFRERVDDDESVMSAFELYKPTGEGAYMISKHLEEGDEILREVTLLAFAAGWAAREGKT